VEPRLLKQVGIVYLNRKNKASSFLLAACGFVFSRMISAETRFNILEIHARN